MKVNMRKLISTKKSRIVQLFGFGLALFSYQASANTPVTGAAFTTVNESADGTGKCKNGNPNVNCNIYSGKEYVWLNGGPAAASLGDGQYFFAVLVPGGQGGHQNPNDGTPLNLSDLNPTTDTGAGDAYINRIFTISGGSISYDGTHDFVDNKIRLMPYDDTENNGGVYILAICNLADDYPVNPSDCKYDAFKVQKGEKEIPSGLAITKDASGSFDRTFAWDIDKAVDKTRVSQVGGTATFNYTVTVSHDEGSDDNWTVNGKITVTNLNTFAVSGVNVSDNILSDTNHNCVVSGGTNATIPAISSQEFDYKCTYSGAPAAQTETNEATVIWPLTGDLQAGSASTQFEFTFVKNDVDECIDVTDAFNGGSVEALGPHSICVGDDNPTEFTYSREVSIPQFNCVDYDNTAAFTANDTGATGSDEVTVTVCGPGKTGALTMGFWQNKNGQGIIKNYCGGTKGISLQAFLFAYKPFKDALAGCTNEAAYVTNIIKAANASGASMNAMLRAQMLATALDVYFSAWALGGNRINAPSPIGAAVIDLTKICTDLTCSNYEDVSSAFGGAASLSVSSILTSASDNATSNTGATWYGQDKSVQELAKDTFDAINNEKAFFAP